MAKTPSTTPHSGGQTPAALLLKTKLFVPIPRPDLLPRPRLAERLNEILRLDNKLGLICAPAGFGKTTLLAWWVAGSTVTALDEGFGSGKDRAPQGPAVAWVSLDEGDNDPARFLAYIASAMQAFEPTIGESTLAALRSPQPPPAELLLTNLINELVTALAPGHAPQRHCVLIVDDYHVIKDQAVHNAVSFLLDRLPPRVHLAVASRSDPPLPLARLRGRGQLIELRAADLRFTPAEARDFLNQVMGTGLSAQDIAVLDERTEGWATGLQLAALSLRRQAPDRIPELLQEFAGSHRFILDYLVEEVLKQQPEWVQAFLLQTSVLDRLSGPLCNALTGRDDGQSILESLERANLFIVPLDGIRQWYRYHHLFRDLLRARLNQRQGGPGFVQETELHRRASKWYETNELIAEAIAHAIRGGDPDRASSLVEAHAMEMLMRGELTTLLDWLATLPGESVAARPWLSVYHAWALLLTGRLDAVEPRLKDVTEAIDERSLQGHVAAIRAYMAGISGHRQRAIELAQEAFSLLPEEDLAVRAVVSYTLGGTSLLVGDIAGAGRAFIQASILGRKSGNFHVAVPALCSAARLQAEQGLLGQAVEAYREALRWAAGDRGSLLPIAASALSGLGEVLYEWNDLESAAQHLNQSIRLGLQWGNLEALTSDYGTLALVYQAQGQPEEADNTLRQAVRLAHEREGVLTTLGRIRAYRARLDVALGHIQAAAGWAQKYETTAGGAFDDLHDFENLTLARVLLALGEAGKAATLLARRLEAAERTGRRGRTVEILALQALARQAQGDSGQAMACLEKALSLAQPAGYVRTFLDEGEPMARLLFDLGRQKSPAIHQYVTHLCAVWTATVAGRELPARDHIPQESTSPSDMVEPLSEREAEVLKLVAEGLTNRQIADRLVIAVSTVKSHTNNIYGKLGVQNRTQAIAQARTLGLLD